MFFLVTLDDLVTVEPGDLGKSHVDRLIAAIQTRYVDRIIPDVGLVIAFYDFLRMGDAPIFPGNGSVHFNCRFRLVAFRPFKGEILTGRLVRSAPEGLTVSLGFFEDIRIPCTLLREPSEYDDVDKVWFWRYGEHSLYLDLLQNIRFKVEEVQFHKQDGGQHPVALSTSRRLPPMTIIGSINSDGLGLESWWQTE
ncbi:unnamed protein product [Vitrella brassicaformis CCMP3155]|uniref:Uncharacterized protein n=2 Tax=Vitrella brassicaformis TaxID=1169539 RepID=A0A0G4ECD8_VITBC|nr:unnamed protein product [Vitrella brassicaformis CCMP3155]|mmetsp:Transcript_44844/g.111421  ORF Transcript_44844/g.111421 Transcript_44844/m.111421 type:complete len:195 (+) Transcript_44844:102-686(+)|eukprot:CEL93173.1 unnamed protein product [Vitrella brassicaformis CCMP3155]